MSLNERIRLKKLLKKLKSYRGKHTEFVSVYIPQGYELSKIVQNLRLEQQTATNIKDKNNAKAVINALEKLIQVLSTYKRTPENGLAIFSGNISQKENVDNYETFPIEPLEPLNLKMYRCDQKFILDPLLDTVNNKEIYGLVAMDKGEACVGILEGSAIKVIKTLTSNVPGKHKTGGQSAQRFARIREGAAIEFYKRIAEILISEFTYKKEMKGILIGGPGTTKNNFFDGNYINEDIKRRVIPPLMDITYTNDFGLKELCDKAQDILKESEVADERKLLQKFFEKFSKNFELISYGYDQIIEKLNLGCVDKIILIDSIEDYQLEKIGELAEKSKSELFLVTNKTPEGKQLEGLGGIGAILRYSI